MAEIKHYTLNSSSDVTRARARVFTEISTLNFGSGITRAARALASTEIQRVHVFCECRDLRGAAYV